MKKFYCVLAFLAMVCMISAVSLHAATINVPGPYGPTIQAAINAASPGDIINVAAGTYPEQITISKALTINGADGAILDGSSLGLKKDAVKIYSSNVTFDNIDVINFSGNGIIIGYPLGNYQNVHITNCKIANIQPGYSHGFGIYAGHQSEDFKRPSVASPKLAAHLDYSGLLIEYNEITNTKSSALVLQSITGTPGSIVVQNNYIHHGMNDGIWIDCARNIVIKNNIVANNTDGFYISSYADNFIEPPPDWKYENPWMPHLGGPYSPKNITITGNQIIDNVTYGGIYLESGYPATIFINDNDISGNTPGITNYLNEPVDATNNWWGDATGPLHLTSWIYNLNPYGPHAGLGDEVSDYVLYDPWTGKLGSFIIEEAKVDFKKKPTDDKIHVKGTLIFAPGSTGLADSEITYFTIRGTTGGAFTQNVPVSRKGKQDRWEYKRPKGTDTGIKELIVDVTKKKIKFDIHVDNAEIGTAWTNPVFISLQIGNNYGDASITMDIKKDKMEYHNK